MALTSCLAKEFGRDGILVNIVMPALTSTERVMATVPEPVRAMIAGHLASGRLSTLSRTGYATEYFNYDDYSQLNRAGLDVDSNAALSTPANGIF